MAAPCLYLLSRRDAEHDRLRLQSRVWEPAGPDRRSRPAARGARPRCRLRRARGGCGSSPSACPTASSWAPTSTPRRSPSPARPATTPATTTSGSSRTTCYPQRAARGRCSTSSTWRFQLGAAGAARADQLRRLPPAAEARRHPRGRGARQPAPGPTSLYARASGLADRAHRPGLLACAGGDLDAGRRPPRSARAPTWASRPSDAPTPCAGPRARPPLPAAAAAARRCPEAAAARAARRRRARRPCSTAAAAEIGEPGRAGTTFTLVQSWARVA